MTLFDRIFVWVLTFLFLCVLAGCFYFLAMSSGRSIAILVACIYSLAILGQ